LMTAEFDQLQDMMDCLRDNTAQGLYLCSGTQQWATAGILSKCIYIYVNWAFA